MARHYRVMNLHSKIVRNTVALFKLNRSQAVRIPKELAFPDTVKEVVIRRQGRSLVISPKHSYWSDFFAMGPSPDFPERDQPPPQERDWSFDD